MTEDSETHVKQLHTALAASEAFRGITPADVDVLRTIARPVSLIHQVQIRRGGNTDVYWVKFHLDGNADVEREFSFLQASLDRLHGLHGLDVPSPIALLENPPGLVTKHVGGTPLSSLIKRRANRFFTLFATDSKALQSCFQCGRWLAALHQHAPSASPFDRAELTNYVRIRLERLSDELGADPAFCQKVQDFVEEQASRAQDEDFVRVDTHGDFAPYNALVDGDALHVMDPAVGGYFGRMGYLCPRYDDVVHFFNFVRYMSIPVVSDATRRRLTSSFLDGYAKGGGRPIDPSSGIFRAFWIKYRLLNAFDEWPSILTRLSTPSRRVKSFESWYLS